MRAQDALKRLPHEVLVSLLNRIINRFEGGLGPATTDDDLRALLLDAVERGWLARDPADWNGRTTLFLWPRAAAHMICESLGYCTPSSAAAVLMDAKARRPNYCEWVDACFKGDAGKPALYSWKARHQHKGFMADYDQALQIVQETNAGRGEPMFASWF